MAERKQRPGGARKDKVVTREYTINLHKRLHGCCRLRAFALPGLRASAARSFLGCLMQCNNLMFGTSLQMFPPFVCLCDLIPGAVVPYDDKIKACFSTFAVAAKELSPYQA